MTYQKQPWHRLYHTAAWLRLQEWQVSLEPLCRFCLELGRTNDGSLTYAGHRQTNQNRRFLVADHIIAHKGDEGLFFDPDNLQTLCPDHHDRTKQQEERRGYSQTRGDDGWPIDPRHPANRT